MADVSPCSRWANAYWAPANIQIAKFQADVERGKYLRIF
jgi:hypothetical protein